MEAEKSDIDLLLSDTGDFLETKASLWKLKTVDTLSDSVSTLASGIGIICIAGLFLLIMSIGLALLIGDWLGKNYIGFFIIGGVYGFAGILFYVFRDRWLKEPVTNILIREMLKNMR